MPLFSRKKKALPSRDVKQPVEHTNGHTPVPTRPKFTSNWDSTEIVPEEVEELIHLCTLEIKSRAQALDTPFLLLPFRPKTDVAPTRTFIRNFYKSNRDGAHGYRAEALQQELRLTDTEVLCSIVKWCWSRLPGGVVSWSVYEAFKVGENESNMSRTAFDTFIPLGTESVCRRNIIYDFFDLLSAVAAHSKVNGLSGRKLSRLAGWWAFDHRDTGSGFDGGYRSWAEAADASSHLFFGYLRSRAPEAVDGITGISNLPRSLQALVAQTEYPPETPVLLQTSTAKVLMMVDSVSPTPLSLLRRAKNFEYRSEDRDLQYYSEYIDPMQALTPECLRVLDCIASANQSATRAKRGQLGNSRLPSGLTVTGDDSWARFQDEGFSGFTTEATTSGDRSNRQSPQIGSLQGEARSRGMAGDRPTTPSWADFLNSGFADEARSKSTPALILPPDKQLPPLSAGGSNGNEFDDEDLEPGELASITTFKLDDTFWWVWMMSLANEEPAGRKAAFGRCALIETSIAGGTWFLMEEQVKGAAAVLTEGAYIAEKKSRFGFSRRHRSTRTKPAQPQPLPEHVNSASAAFRATSTTPNKGSMTLDQQARIKAAAAELSQQETSQHLSPDKRGRNEDAASTKTNSVLTLGLSNTANPAMEWAKAYDKEEVRRQYLGDNFAGKGLSYEERSLQAMSTDLSDKENQPVRMTSLDNDGADRDLPPLPAAKARPDPAQVTSSEILLAPLPPQPQRVAPVRPEQGAPLAARAAEVHLPPVTPREEPAETLTSQIYATSVPPAASFPPSAGPSPAVPAATRRENKSPVVEESYVDETPACSESIRELAPHMDATVSPDVNSVERKPVSEAKVHPAFRNQPPEPSSVDASPSSQKQSNKNAPAQVAAARAFWHSQAKPTDGGPVFAEQEHKKLNKKDRVPTAGALKKMFGRKKEDAGQRSMDTAPCERTLAPPSGSKVGRSPSLIRKKTGPRGAESGSEVPASGNRGVAEHQHSPLLVEEAPPISEDMLSEHEHLARTDTKDTNNAKQEFSRFDQGPMIDAPTFVPGGPVSPLKYEPYDPDRTPNAGGETETEYVSPQRPHLQAQQESVYVTPPTEVDDEMHPGYGNADDQGNYTVEAPVVDRWAQIRKNAAERAARVSEEQSTRSRGQSIATEGASETSGEETIEERVARIKARVAELTGNMTPRGAVVPLPPRPAQRS